MPSGRSQVQYPVQNAVQNAVQSPVHGPVQSPESRFCTDPYMASLRGAPHSLHDLLYLLCQNVPASCSRLSHPDRSLTRKLMAVVLRMFSFWSSMFSLYLQLWSKRFVQLGISPFFTSCEYIVVCILAQVLVGVYRV